MQAATFSVSDARPPSADAPKGTKPSPAASGHMPALAGVMPKVEPLTRTDNWRNILYILQDWLVVAGAILLALLAWDTAALPAAYAGATILIGSRMRALMNLVHQTSHGQLFADKRLNRWVGRVFVAWPLLVSVRAYREEHHEHHLHLWDHEEDPKFHRLVWLGLVAPDGRRLRFLWKHVVRPFTLRFAPRNVLGALFGTGERVGRACFAAIVVVVSVLVGAADELVLFWVVPYLTTFQVLRYWAEMAEHSGLESDRPWSATRNWTAPLPVRWLVAPHSDHWHLVHHLCSQVPHYRLAAAHVILSTVPEYVDEGHHCDGLLFTHRPDAPSVIEDMMRPDALAARRPRRAAPAIDLEGGLDGSDELADAVEQHFLTTRARDGWGARFPEVGR